MNKAEKKKLEELKKEYENLPRSQRRKKERELQKLFNDPTIRIKNGKTFEKGKSFNRKQRRELMKNKDLLREVIKIIHKYFPMLDSLLSELTDQRNQSYVTYKIKTLVMTRLIALICGIISMNEMKRKFNTEESIKNLSSICKQKLKEVPDWQTIQDVIEQLDINEINNIRKYMINAVIRNKMFNKYRYKGCFQLLVDATGVSSHDYNLNNNCISKTHNGNTKYFKYVLEAKLRVGPLVLSLDSEWIENTEINNENEKQDCEIKAFKRMAPRIKKEFPKLKFLVTGDALYGSEPMIKLCQEYKWHYIFNLKKNRLKNVYNDFEDNIHYKNEVTISNYYLSSNIEYKGFLLSAFRYVDIDNKKEFNYISDLEINNHNIKEIVSLGRARWKIENCGFYVQKHGTFCISHLCSRNENALKIHYLLIQIAHMIRQLLEFGSILLREMKITIKKEVSYHITKCLTSTISDLSNLETNFQLRFDD